MIFCEGQFKQLVKKFTREELNLIIDDYVTRLKSKIQLDQVILFGSYAKGFAHDYSDIDLLVISKDLPINKPKGANGLYLDQLVGLKNINPSLEVLGIHPSKLSNAITKGFFKEVLSTGITIEI